MGLPNCLRVAAHSLAQSNKEAEPFWQAPTQPMLAHALRQMFAALTWRGRRLLPRGPLRGPLEPLKEKLDSAVHFAGLQGL